jgi:hypothetical protein
MSDLHEKTAEEIAAEAYQVIGLLASAVGLFDHPEIVRALDYFSTGWSDPGTEILPWNIPDRKPE